jgi:hypothetical protein
MYEVDLNAAPESFLDWDTPLSGQGERVRERFARFPQEMRGSDAYSTLQFGVDPTGFDESGRALFNGVAAINGRNPNAATGALRSAGIPGIRYLDQGSRSAGQGSRNYVVFDDSLIEILRKYGIAGLTAGGAGAGVANKNQGPRT